MSVWLSKWFEKQMSILLTTKIFRYCRWRCSNIRQMVFLEVQLQWNDFIKFNAWDTWKYFKVNLIFVIRVCFGMNIGLFQCLDWNQKINPGRYQLSRIINLHPTKPSLIVSFFPMYKWVILLNCASPEDFRDISKFVIWGS